METNIAPIEEMIQNLGNTMTHNDRTRPSLQDECRHIHDCLKIARKGKDREGR